MKRIGLYPGSFNPLHSGHKDIIQKALKVFDKVLLLVASNPDKDIFTNIDELHKSIKKITMNSAILDWYPWKGDSLKNFLDLDPHSYDERNKPSAIIRGLRNGHDLQYEMNQQYWNEDVGIKIPFVYFITDRKLSHVSSSAIRMVEGLGLKHDY
jgi:pantetheine-phosphate adenylyltransferase